MKQIWFLSDPHFFHHNVIKYSNRPFENVQEMNDAIIKNINDKVQIEDELYILGDFVFGNESQAINILRRIKCKNLHYVFGNHDKNMHHPSLKGFFKSMDSYKEIFVTDDDAHGKKQRIVLCHFPILEWNQGHRGAWMLHGHCHGNLVYPPSLQNKKITDMGVDCWDYSPASYEEVKALFKNRSNITHHGD